MNVLSLFDGMSCGQIALERAGIKVDNYYAAEIDKHAIKVTQENYPNTIQMGDVSFINKEDLPKIDLLIGGSPCQSFSPAISSNTGFSGKSKLFFEYLRLLKVLKPKYFLLENVVMKKEWERVINKNLEVNPVFINSDIFSAQSRPRIYWTNFKIQKIQNKNQQKLKDIILKNVDEKYFYKESYNYISSEKVVEAELNIKGHDIIKRVNNKNFKCQCLTAVCGGNQQKKIIDGDRVRKLTPVEYERLQNVPDNYTSCVSDSARYKMLGNGWTVDVIAHIFKSMGDKPEKRKVDAILDQLEFNFK